MIRRGQVDETVKGEKYWETVTNIGHGSSTNSTNENTHQSSSPYSKSATEDVLLTELGAIDYADGKFQKSGLVSK